MRDAARLLPKWRLESKYLFHERWDRCRIGSELLLQRWIVGQYSDRVAEQAARCLTSCAEQRVQDQECFT